MSWSSFCLIAYCSLTPGSFGLLAMPIGPSSSTRRTRSLLRRPGAQSSLEPDARAAADRGRADERAAAAPRLPAGAADDVLEPLVVGVATELDEQPRDGRRLPVGARQPVASGSRTASGGRRGQAGDESGDGAPEQDERETRTRTTYALRSLIIADGSSAPIRMIPHAWLASVP